MDGLFLIFNESSSGADLDQNILVKKLLTFFLPYLANFLSRVLVKSLRVDSTRIFVESTRNTVQLAMQCADSTRKIYFYSHAFVLNQQACG
jgi:hypothetical protein